MRAAEEEAEIEEEVTRNLRSGNVNDRGSVSPFRLNAGTWLGSQVGSTLWLFVGSGVLVASSILASSVWAVSFVLANALGLTCGPTGGAWECTPRCKSCSSG